MNFSWLTWSNPVAIWWFFLVSLSVINILSWTWTHLYLHRRDANFSKTSPSDLPVRTLLMLSGLYVFGCAFRSVLPRADVQRICLFDHWISNVFVGRSVATIAELSFVIQWAIVLNYFAKFANSRFALMVSYLVVPLIFIAECFSWYAVITTHYIGNACEESLWAISYSLLAVSLIILWPKFQGALKYAMGITIAGTILYVAFMVRVDVPMYLSRWTLDNLQNKTLFGLSSGLHDLLFNWKVTHDINDWKEEIPWMSLYFSVAVWASLALCYMPSRKTSLSKYYRA